MKRSSHTELNNYLQETGKILRERLLKIPFLERLGDGPIKDRLLDYVMRGGKNLRPGMTGLACGAVGGNPENAIDIGIAIEITHTWTLVHDDIIDRDDSRRGGPSVHARIRQDYSEWEINNPGMTTEHLANSMALLVGDAQHAMAMDIISQSAIQGRISNEIALFLISRLEGQVLPDLLTGEVDDVFQTGIPLSTITRDEILLMLQRKTAALLTFSVLAGAMIGLNTIEENHPYIHGLKAFSDNLGIAFQLRDDILGILGDEIKLGKPVGSDFREGKRTLAVKIAWENSSQKIKARIESLLGKPDLLSSEINELRQYVIDFHGIKSVEELANKHLQDSLNGLKILPESSYRHHLAAIADYCVSRQK